MLRRKRIFRCPICRADSNAKGKPFPSVWAVACHVAGKAKFGDVHRSWVMHNVPEAVPLRRLKLADALVWPIQCAIEAMENMPAEEGPEDRRPKIGFHD